MLPLETFKTVIESTPLISIDLVVKNNKGQILLGKRTNRPAKDFWFVPGGRVLKNEPLDTAFKRLIKVELGLTDLQCQFNGIYQHFYDDSYTDKEISTHYIVLAYEVTFNFELTNLPVEQHSSYKWFEEHELVNDSSVHQHTKWYFQKNKQADALFNSTLFGNI